MAWSDEWSRAQRKRVAWRLVTLVMMHVMVVGPAVLVLWFMSRPAPVPAVAAVIPVLIICIFLVGDVVAYRQYQAERAIYLRVPAHDGRVCPQCRRPLEPERDPVCCPGCGGEHAVSSLRAHWEQYPHQWSERQSRPTSGSRWMRIRWLVQDRPWIAVVGLLAVWLVTSAAMVLMHLASPAGALLRSFPMICLGLGTMLVSRGAGRRVGDGYFCAKCDYEQAAGGGGERCPECGHAWTRRGSLVRGRVARSGKLMGAGYLVLVLALVAWLPQLGLGRVAVAKATPTWLLFAEVESRQQRGRSSGEIWPDLAARPLSDQQNERLTWLLIEEITAESRGFVSTEWSALSARPLTPQQRNRLFEGLLDKQTNRGFLVPPDRAWLESMVATAAVPEALRARYVREIEGE